MRSYSPARIIPRKTPQGRGDWEGRSGAYFYAQERPIYQLLEDGKLEWETIGGYIFLFSQKNKDGEETLETVGDALTIDGNKRLKYNIFVVALYI